VEHQVVGARFRAADVDVEPGLLQAEVWVKSVENFGRIADGQEDVGHVLLRFEAAIRKTFYSGDTRRAPTNTISDGMLKSETMDNRLFDSGRPIRS
jgi:hypothetical protein